MIDHSPPTHGLSGDLGWNDTDATPMRVLRSALLLVATGAYFGTIWLLSGLPPLLFVASRVRSADKTDADHQAGSSHVRNSAQV